MTDRLQLGVGALARMFRHAQKITSNRVFADAELEAAAAFAVGELEAGRATVRPVAGAKVGGASLNFFPQSESSANEPRTIAPPEPSRVPETPRIQGVLDALDRTDIKD